MPSVVSLFPEHAAASDFAPGARVGARRWPSQAGHPDCWGDPWAGEVIAIDDPRAWAESAAFPSPSPDPAAVTAHVERARSQGLLGDRIPVLWDFGRVCWETPHALRSARHDAAEFRMARRQALGAFKAA